MRNDDASLDEFIEALRGEVVDENGIPLSEVALRESIKRLRPDFTPEQVEIFMKGR
jgi:hypothetical protein